MVMRQKLKALGLLKQLSLSTSSMEQGTLQSWVQATIHIIPAPSNNKHPSSLKEHRGLTLIKTRTNSDRLKAETNIG